MNSSIILAFAIGVLLIASAQSLLCTQWVSLNTGLIFNPPRTCHGPEIHVSGNNWRLCCQRVTRQELSLQESIEPLLPVADQNRSTLKCSRWLNPSTSPRILLAEDACSTPIFSQMKNSEMRICCE